MLAITATDLPRFMACNGSISMGVSNPPIESNDTVRDEGNAAHWFCETVHSGAHQAEELIERPAPNGVYITPEMFDYCEEYLEHIRQGGHVEYKTNVQGSSWVLNSRTDHVIYEPRTGVLEISDLKYGWSIVDPVMNWTLLAHVFGFMAKNPDKRVTSVVLRIFQPRPHHPEGRVRSWEIDANQINILYAEMANALSNPKNELNTGPDHCSYCPSMAICPAYNKAKNNAIDASERMFRDEIDNERLSFEMDHLSRAIEVLKQLEKAYSELATHRLKTGEIVQNYALDQNLANRSWQDHITPEVVQVLTGQDLTKKTLITPSQAEKKGVSKEIVASLTERRNKGVKLVRMDAHAKAKKLFNNNPKGN